MKNSRFVYSTDGNNNCLECGKSFYKCKCLESENIDISLDGIKVYRETKGRKGTGVTLVRGLKGSNSELKDLAKQIKFYCSAGGSVKARVIEIQGDHRELVKDFLEAKGMHVKLESG